MKPEQLKAIRKKFGLDPVAFGIELGYAGNQNTIKQMMRRYESGAKPIPLTFARYVWLMDQYRLAMNDLGSPDLSGRRALPQWPHWPEYEL
jgi:hypothetical protein